MKDRESYNFYMNNYRKNGPSILNQHEYIFEFDPRKRKRIKQATPSWANKSDIIKIYRECESLNLKYGKKLFIVSHIIPICHKNICGLHIANNLKIMTLNRKMQIGRKFFN